MNLSKRYTFTVKKRQVKRLDRRKRRAGLVSFWVSDASILKMRIRFLDRGKPNVVPINSMVSLSSGLRSQAQEPQETRFGGKTIRPQEKALTGETSTPRDQREPWMYASYFDVAERRALEGVR